MKKLKLKQMENLEGGKFGGNGPDECYVSTIPRGDGGFLDYCCHDYYVFWIPVDTECGYQ